MLPPFFFYKNGDIWCILSAPKYVIINLQTNIFRIINRHQKLCATFFSKINPDAHVSTEINTFIFYNGGLGTLALPKLTKCKKMEFFSLLKSNNTRQARR